jgi:DNA-directed RNA polymerase specialized sigma24 family protein
MNRPPQPEQQGAARSSARTEEGKLSIKRDPARFDTLVARYYPAVYSFASRLTDDPRKAVLLTHNAFKTISKQVSRPRDEITLARILLKAVVRARLTTA